MVTEIKPETEVHDKLTFGTLKILNYQQPSFLNSEQKGAYQVVNGQFNIKMPSGGIIYNPKQS